MTTKVNSRRKQSVAEINGKRFSKAQMKREIISENSLNSNRNSRTIPKKTNEPKTPVIVGREVYKFKGEPKETFSATLKRHSISAYGYSVLSAGQQVTVENFGGGQPLRIIAMDGRVGITCSDNIKPLFS